jgi:hypothetical protein
MKFKLITTVVLVLSLIITVALSGQDIDEKKLERKLKKLEQRLKDKEHQLHSIEIPEMHLDLSGLEESMVHLEHSLAHLEHIEIPEIHVDIPEIDIEMPDIHIDIPEIHIPEIDLDFSHFDFDFDFDFDYDFDFAEFHHPHWNHSHLFENLSEDEEIKVSAIRSMGRQEKEKAIPALKRTIAKESNPAYRYEAVRQLRKFVDEKQVLETLAKVAKSDKNVDVRKKAIHVMGKSENPKAVKILKEIAER